jgi:hypothetical protein
LSYIRTLLAGRFVDCEVNWSFAKALCTFAIRAVAIVRLTDIIVGTIADTRAVTLILSPLRTCCWNERMKHVTQQLKFYLKVGLLVSTEMHYQEKVWEKSSFPIVFLTVHGFVNKFHSD